MGKEMHRFIATAFKTDFNLARLPAEWNSGIVTDPKEIRAKRVLGGGMVYAFSYGALVFWNVEGGERVAEIDNLSRILQASLADRVTADEFIVEVDAGEKPRVEFTKLVIDQLTAERAAVVALLMSQSAAMEYYENLVLQQKIKVVNVITHLQEKGRVPLSPVKLNKFVGEAMATRAEVVGVLHLLDRPDVIWEDQVMDRLYDDIRASFDLTDRFQALEYKLQFIQETVLTVLETKRDSRLYNADLMIIILIVIEVLFTLFDRFHLFGWGSRG